MKYQVKIKDELVFIISEERWVNSNILQYHLLFMHNSVIGMLFHSNLTNLWHSWRTTPPLVAIMYVFNWTHNKLQQPDSGSVLKLPNLLCF